MHHTGGCLADVWVGLSFWPRTQRAYLNNLRDQNLMRFVTHCDANVTSVNGNAHWSISPPKPSQYMPWADTLELRFKLHRLSISGDCIPVIAGIPLVNVLVTNTDRIHLCPRQQALSVCKYLTSLVHWDCQCWPPPSTAHSFHNCVISGQYWKLEFFS